MKFIEITQGENISRFSLDQVRSYHIVYRPKVRKDPAHHLVIVEQKPVKQLDMESRGLVIERCQEDSWRFESFDLAQAAVRVIDA